MTIIEIRTSRDTLTFRQRWNHYFIVLFALGAFFIGLKLRDSALNATTLYNNPQAGIQAAYPQNWLIDTEGDYIFRIRDMSRIGFKTTIQIAAQPVGEGTSTRAILDALNLNRSQILAAYKILSASKTITLPDKTLATAMSYTYAALENDPFLESVPIVVQGVDILTIKRGQAIIITFLCDTGLYDQIYPVFERFLNNLEF